MTPLLARILWAVVVGILTFIVLLVLGQLLHVTALVQFAAPLGVLVGVAYFLSGGKPVI